MSPGALTGTVAVVATGLGAAPAAVARRLAAEGAAVVLLAEAHEEGVAGVGRLAADLEGAGSGRTAVFTLTGTEPSDLDALIEFLGELFR